MRAREEWAGIRTRLGGALSKEDRQILDLLINGDSTPSIARALGQSRSMIWRKAQRLRTLAAEESLPGGAQHPA
jgi:hypothetical protein